MEKLSSIHIKPQFIRAVLHDASDLNNLVDKDGNTYKGKSGIDFCL